jgi:hypothetical protein
MPDIWDNFASSYPTLAIQNAMGLLFTYLKEPTGSGGKNIALKDFLNFSPNEIADLIVDFKVARTTDAENFHNPYVKEFIVAANSLKDGNCLPKGQLDSLFFNAIRDESRDGVVELLITLKEATPGVEVSIDDITCSSGEVNSKAAELTETILTLPCSHGYISGQAKALVTDASNFIASVTNNSEIQLQFSASGTYLQNYRLEWFEDAGDEPIIVSSSQSNPQGYLSISYSTVTNMLETYTTPTVRIFDENDEPVKFKDPDVDPPMTPVTEFALAFPPETAQINLLKRLVIYPNPETYTGGSEVFDSEMYTFMNFESSPENNYLRNYLNTKNIYDTFIKIREAGGVEFLISNALTGGDIANAIIVNKFANLDLVSPNRYFNKHLIFEEDFDHFLDIISITRVEFVAIAESVVDEDGMIRQYNAAEIYEKTLAVSTYLNNYITERRKEYANAN